MPHLDVYLIRFLCLAQWRLTPACEEQLARTAMWRKTSGANEYRRRLAANETKFGGHPLVGTFLTAHVVLPQQGETHNGDRIKIRELGTLNAAYFLSAITDEQAIAFFCNQIEADAFDADAHSTARGHLVRWAQFSLLTGLGVQHVKPRMLSRLKRIAPIIEAYYPEYLGLSVTLAAPRLAVRVWHSVVQFLFTPETRRRVCILGSPSEPATRAALERIVRLSELPLAFGGTREAMPEAVRAEIGFGRIDPQSILEAAKGRRLGGYISAHLEGPAAGLEASAPGQPGDRAAGLAGHADDERNGESPRLAQMPGADLETAASAAEGRTVRRHIGAAAVAQAPDRRASTRWDDGDWDEAWEEEEVAAEVRRGSDACGEDGGRGEEASSGASYNGSRNGVGSAAVGLSVAQVPHERTTGDGGFLLLMAAIALAGVPWALVVHSWLTRSLH